MQSPTLKKILSSNPLAVLMVLEGLNRYSAEVAASSVDDYPSMGIVHPESWIALARDIQQQLKSDRAAFK